jgi:energy-coupling factor transporter ATP-binding protein EcfA2
MKRILDDLVATDLERKLVVLTGPRQVGKTTLARSLMSRYAPTQYLNWDIADDRGILQRASWERRSRLLVMDEIHKMPNWKAWLKGVVDGREPQQALLVTGSARMDTFRQSGESPTSDWRARVVRAQRVDAGRCPAPLDATRRLSRTLPRCKRRTGRPLARPVLHRSGA